MSQGAYDLVPVPLVEATIQVRFPGDARIDAVRGNFQQAIVDEFPLLFVPEVSAGDSPALVPYRFQNQDGTRTLALAINSLAYLSKQYPGWVTFRAEFMNYWAALTSRVEFKSLGRIGMRYINRFDGELLKRVNLAAPEYLAPLNQPKCDFLRSASNYEEDEIAILVNVHKPQNEETLILDYDAYTQSASLAALEDTLDVLHDRIETEFRRALDDAYAKMLTTPKAGG